MLSLCYSIYLFGFAVNCHVLLDNHSSIAATAVAAKLRVKGCLTARTASLLLLVLMPGFTADSFTIARVMKCFFTFFLRTVCVSALQ